MTEQNAGATATPPRPRPGRPAKLSSAAIVTAALALLDREGTEALTMRRLGAELGVEAMSLYRHVADRAALLDALAERLAAEIERRESADWADALRTLGGELRALARRHPAAFELVGMRVLAGPHELGAVEDSLSALRRAGFAPARAIFAHRLVTAYARGYALTELAGFAVAVDPREPLPAVRALGRRLASEPTDASFRAGLETIIGGLRTERET